MQQRTVRSFNIFQNDGDFYIQPTNPQTNRTSGAERKLESPCDFVMDTTQEEPGERVEVSVINVDGNEQMYRRKIKIENGREKQDTLQKRGSSGGWKNVDNSPAEAFAWHNERMKAINFRAEDGSDRFSHIKSELNDAQRQTIQALLLPHLSKFKSTCTSVKEYRAGLTLRRDEQAPQWLLAETAIAFQKLQECQSRENLTNEITRISGEQHPMADGPRNQFLAKATSYIHSLLGELSYETQEEKTTYELALEELQGQYHIFPLDPITQQRSDASKPLAYPCDFIQGFIKKGAIEIARLEISALEVNGEKQVYRRTINIGRNGNETPGLIQIKNAQPPHDWQDSPNIPQEAFQWHTERTKKFSHLTLDGAGRFASPLSPLQRQPIDVVAPELITNFKSQCSSKAEYEAGLHYLIHGGAAPRFLLELTNSSFEELSLSLGLPSIRQNFGMLNNSNTYMGHFATLREVKEYVQMVLQEALKEVQPTYNEQIPAATYTTEEEELAWNRLAMTSMINANEPLSREIQELMNGSLQAILAVQKSGTTSLKENLTSQNLETLKAADQVLTRLIPLMRPNGNETLSRHILFFLGQMSQPIDRPRGARIEDFFLSPLQKNVQAKIEELEIAERIERQVANPGPEGVEVEGQNNLLNPGFRAKIQTWFDKNDLGQITYDAQAKTLTGQLSGGTGGAQLVIHANKILVHKASGALSDTELRQSMTEIVEMLSDVYGGIDKIPPLTPMGTPEQQASICTVLKAHGVKVVGGPPVEAQPAPENADANANLQEAHRAALV